MTGGELPEAPIALHGLELDGRRVTIAAHLSGLVSVRNGSDGQVLFHRRLPRSISHTACAALDGGAPTLFAVSGQEVLAHDLRTDTTSVIGASPERITALAAGRPGEHVVVATGDSGGSVGVFTPGEDGSWSGAFIPAHRSQVIGLSLGLASGRSAVISCSDNATVSVTPVGGTSATFWEVVWDSAGTTCVWRNHGRELPYDENALLETWWQHPANSHPFRTRILLDKQARRVRGCEVVNVGGTVVALVTGEHQSHSILAVGDLPTARNFDWRAPALRVKGNLAAVHQVDGGARLAFVRGTTVHTGLLEWVTGRILPDLRFYPLALSVLCVFFPAYVLQGFASAALLSALHCGIHYCIGRRTVRGIRLRYTAEIDLHSEVIDVDFDGPEGLVVLAQQGIAAFELAREGP
ncbi:hypothetical protein ACFVRB_12520 [Streptomyces nojiriensis]|uniref:hypothetical protein n=1 Tax=Streptomyces nojiriensis TaxID=66374 RepID=UPI0036D9825D